MNTPTRSTRLIAGITATLVTLAQLVGLQSLADQHRGISVGAQTSSAAPAGSPDAGRAVRIAQAR